MGNPQKCPVGERVPKQRVPKRYFAIFLHRVACSGAGWAPIVFRARVPIGITRSYRPDQLPIWTCRVDSSRAHSATVLRQRHGADRAPARAARNGGAASKTRLTTCEAQTAMASSHRAASWIEGQHSPTNVDVGTDPAGQVC